MVGGHSWNKGWSREGTAGIRGGLGFGVLGFNASATARVISRR